MSSQTGIKSESLFTNVLHFFLTKDALLDPMHILLEGVIPKEIRLSLKLAIHEKHWFSREQLNATLKSFAFHVDVSHSDYPRPFDQDLCVVASASASWVLVLHLPLILRLPARESTCGAMSRETDKADASYFVPYTDYSIISTGRRDSRGTPPAFLLVLWCGIFLSEAAHVNSRR